MNTPTETLIRDRITSLEDVIGQLRDRLDTVLVPSPPTAVSSSGATPGTAPAASHVRGRLESLIEQVRDMQLRLEV